MALSDKSACERNSPFFLETFISRPWASGSDGPCVKFTAKVFYVKDSGHPSSLNLRPVRLKRRTTALTHRALRLQLLKAVQRCAIHKAPDPLRVDADTPRRPPVDQPAMDGSHDADHHASYTDQRTNHGLPFLEVILGPIKWHPPSKGCTLADDVSNPRRHGRVIAPARAADHHARRRWPCG